MTTQAVIIGGSHAGVQLCASLRQNGWTGQILMISDEPGLPYHRPPLSKGYLSGQAARTDLLIRSSDFYEKQRIDRSFAQVKEIDRQSHRIILADGREVVYDKLALCLGARPRPLVVPGADLAGVHYLRTTSDIEAIKDELAGVVHVVIVGAGYIGLELAASLRALGIAVTVLETADRVLQRVTAPQVSEFYARVHREEGVQIRTGIIITALEGSVEKNRVRGVRCADGELIEAGLVIVGIGVQPNVELAQAAGLVVDNGILIDAHGCTSDPDIVAAGDCANHFSSLYGRRIRLESVPNAIEHAKVAAATLCGKPGQISALPWFWSDQFDLKLQIAGLNAGHDKVVVRGNYQSGRSFSCFYFNNDRLIAADCVNRAQEFLLSKRLIAEKVLIDSEMLADERFSMESLLTKGQS